MSKIIEQLKNPPMKTVDIWRCIDGAVDDTKCVMDGGCIQDCNEAIRLQKAGLQKESCSGWRRYTYDNIDYPAWEQSILAALKDEGWQKIVIMKPSGGAVADKEEAMSGKSVRDVLSDKLLLAYRVDDVLADIRAAMPSIEEICRETCEWKECDNCHVDTITECRIYGEAIHKLILDRLQ